MPFEQALAAAGGGGVLGDEYRVAAHRRLPAVVGDFRRRQPLTDKIFGMPADGVEPFLPDIGNVRRLQPEAVAERRTAQTGKNIFCHDGAPILFSLL